MAEQPETVSSSSQPAPSLEPSSEDALKHPQVFFSSQVRLSQFQFQSLSLGVCHYHLTLLESAVWGLIFLLVNCLSDVCALI